MSSSPFRNPQSINPARHPHVLSAPPILNRLTTRPLLFSLGVSSTTSRTLTQSEGKSPCAYRSAPFDLDQSRYQPVI
ncbi:hypothetical protein M427DRAFT_60841 [Gonapodya prolifera JEL478]|uniref:Uncharacterized protein n=1 Tax=Gonapodya prolifera (strain JEL478) TaxID=1344416 RepID=A0A139A3I1_GONPJ|nr:hypothetical protein M427DRAFT_60841 [Gonapodya prolifera JEL478]|eukprot:KXS11274.1 hypothetical protein M427DRAFT_60841 [Gonapodya prolifera JEL478]